MAIIAYAAKVLKVPMVRQSTLFDALSHSIESYWSKNATKQSRIYSQKAIRLILKYLKFNRTKDLILAGNYAGHAIAIAKTNVVHAISYSITIKYGTDHGTACGILLPHVVEYMDYKGLPKLFHINSTDELVRYLKKVFNPPKIKGFDPKIISRMSLKYKKINEGPKKLDTMALNAILSKVAKQKGIN